MTPPRQSRDEPSGTGISPRRNLAALTSADANPYPLAFSSTTMALVMLAVTYTSPSSSTSLRT